MILVFILFLILSSPSRAVLIKNDVSDLQDRCFVDSAGNEAPLKLLLTKISFQDEDRNGTPELHPILLDQSVKFGEVLKINFADYFPNHKSGDDIFLSAFIDGETSQVFAKKLVTTQNRPLKEDDTIVVWADVFFTRLRSARSTPLQQFYMLNYYVAGIEQERPELLGIDGYGGAKQGNG